jgi:phospholipid N-methyltransferase
MTTFAEHRTFLRRAAARPDLMGTFTPTSTRTAAEIARIVPRDRPTTVVELGAGTGALCPAVRDRLAGGSRYVAVEVDAQLVAHLRASLPWLEVLAGDAADLDDLLDGAGVGPVDAVVSSLPWTLIGAARRRRMFATIAGRLAPGGGFATINHLTAPPWRVCALRRDLETAFDEVFTTAPVWRNLPPARLHVCRRPC